MTITTTKKQRRARTVRRVTVGVAAGAAVGLAVAGAAVAARRTERVLPKLPAPGATVDAELISKGVELAVAGHKIRTGPLQGRAVFEIEAHRGDPAAVRTRIKEFHLASTDVGGGVTITVEPQSVSKHDPSVLQRASAESPRFQHSLTVPCVITIANPRALGLPAGTDEPLMLKANVPAELAGKPSGFPDARARYRLKERTVLSVVEQPGREASILKFPLRIQQF